MGGYHVQLHLCFFPEKMANFKRPKRPRFSLECIVDSPEEKQTLTTRLDNLRKRLSMDNKAILYAIFDAVEEKVASVQPPSGGLQTSNFLSSSNAQETTTTTKSFLHFYRTVVSLLYY